MVPSFRFRRGCLSALLALSLLWSLLPAPADAQGSIWTPLTAGNRLNAVVFADGSEGWAVGQLGLILHTVDGGASWARQTSGAVQELRAVAFSGGHVWAAGDGGTILHSRGGAAWEAQTAGLTKTLRGISFVDASNGWAVGGDVGNDMTILRTSNGGATWTAQQVTDGGAIFYAVSPADANNGWAAGESGKVIHTGLSLSIRASVPIVLKNHAGGW